MSVLHDDAFESRSTHRGENTRLAILGDFVEQAVQALGKWAARLSNEPERRKDRATQLGGRKGLEKQPVVSELPCDLSFDFRIGARKEQDLRRFLPLLGTDTIAKLKPGHPGEIYVEQQEVIRGLLKPRKRILRGRDGLDMQVVMRQGMRDEFRNVLIIVDAEDPSACHEPVFYAAAAAW